MPLTEFSDSLISAQWWLTQSTIQRKWMKEKMTKAAVFFLFFSSFFYFFFTILVWNEAQIISNGNPPYGYTGDCSEWWLIAKLSPMLNPCWRTTKRDKMAYGKDLTLQMSLLSSCEQTIYVTFFLFLEKNMKSSFRENPASTSQDSLQYSLKANHLETCLACYVVTVWNLGQTLLCLAEGTICNFCVLRQSEWCKSRPPSPQMV